MNDDSLVRDIQKSKGLLGMYGVLLIIHCIL